MKPTCKLCEARHWTYEEHVAGPESVRALGASVLRNTVTKPKDESVTVYEESPFRGVPPIKKVYTKTHGGARGGSGRAKKHKTNAERQRAYRERSRG